MATKLFDCESCGAHGKINFKEDDQFRKSDIAYCPFCGGDIFEDEKYDDEED
jgi:alkyl hydroperoxide reductase subunit AhpF